MTDATPEVTRLLAKWGNGNREALDALTPLVYNELRRLAKSYLRRERPDHTLEGTALVHEAYLRLVDQRQIERGSGHLPSHGKARLGDGESISEARDASKRRNVTALL